MRQKRRLLSKLSCSNVFVNINGTAKVRVHSSFFYFGPSKLPWKFAVDMLVHCLRDLCVLLCKTIPMSIETKVVIQLIIPLVQVVTPASEAVWVWTRKHFCRKHFCCFLFRPSQYAQYWKLSIYSSVFNWGRNSKREYTEEALDRVRRLPKKTPAYSTRCTVGPL